MINLNEDKYNSSDIAVFNDGNAGVVENVAVRIEPKAADAAENAPDYKLIFTDGKGEVNEGFYYQESEDAPGWANYQSKKLKSLAVGVMGENFEIPPAGSPKEALTAVMQIIGKEVPQKAYRVLVTYGTTRRPNDYLQVKAFGSFIESADIACTLEAERSDLLVRPEAKPASDEDVDKATGGTEVSSVPWEANS